MIRSHLLKLHQAAHEVHGRLAKTHGRIAELHRTAAASYSKSADEIREDCHNSLAEEHADLSDHHADHAAFHKAMAKALETARGDDIDTVRPSRFTDRGEGGDLDAAWKVHGVLPTIPAGMQLVPRPGQEISTENVDPALRKLFE